MCLNNQRRNFKLVIYPNLGNRPSSGGGSSDNLQKASEYIIMLSLCSGLLGLLVILYVNQQWMELLPLCLGLSLKDL